MSKIQALLIILVLWATIYLPSLGTTELKGEEARRILPGVTMLETGDWIVPHIGGEKYLRKPPLVNWCAAAGINALGVQNEWAVRLPVTLFVLGLAIGIFLWSRTFLTNEVALAAVIIALTNISLLEKGRLIEIEALYISLTGLAIVSWLSLWIRRAPQWQVWVIPGIFLGLGMLAKGPVHLLFFYAIAAAVIGYDWQESKRRSSIPAIVLGLLVIFGIFAVWAWPYLQATKEVDAGGTWKEQFTGRMDGSDFKLAKWLENIPRGILNFLPWAVFLPFLWHKKWLSALPAELVAPVKGIRLALVVTYFLIMLMPGSVPRYTLPLLTPASILVAMLFLPNALGILPGWLTISWRRFLLTLTAVCGVGALAIPFLYGASIINIVQAAVLVFTTVCLFLMLRKLHRPITLVFGTATVVALGVFVYSAAIVPKVVEADNLRPIARDILDATPENKTIYIYRSDYQPILFYLGNRIQYALEGPDLYEAEYVLMREKHWLPRTEKRRWQNARVIAEFPDRDEKPYYFIYRPLNDSP